MALAIGRILRRKWSETQQFAEEMYAVLRNFKTEGMDGPLVINPRDNEPGLVINYPEGSEVPPIQIVIGDKTYTVPGVDVTPFVPRLPDNPTGFTPTGGGNPNPGTFFAPSLPAYLDDPEPANVWPDGAEGGGSPIPDDESGTRLTGVTPIAVPFTTLGRVVSGSGSSYIVDIYLGPLTSAAYMRLNATVPQIDAGETVPANTVVYVTCFYGASGNIVTAQFQPPVFLEDPE